MGVSYGSVWNIAAAEGIELVRYSRLDKVEQGGLTAAREVIDRTDGKAVQRLIVTRC
jgi:hypothetical protein